MKHGLSINAILARGIAVGALSFGMAGPALALEGDALPSGGQVVGGGATFDYSSPNELHVHQSTDRAIIDWDSFNIGANALTQFHQPGASSIVVNRVTGEGHDPTQILGALRANGIVMVLDRNGVIFGDGARVDVGGIIASTGSINDSAFMAGSAVHLRDIDTGGAIINHGTISVADAGLAAFVAPTVVNSGVIQAKLGTVVLASGDTATLDLYGDGLVEVAVTDKDMQQALTNTGLIHADGGTVQITAAAAKNVVNSVINIDGIVSASSATVKGGRIILGAGHINIAQSATLDASSSAADGGEIILYADDATHVAGTLKASGGAGGFIETSATRRVTIADSARIDTGGGQWLIDPTNFTIADAGGDITTAALAAQLALNNITIETADAGGDAGDIFVNSALTWTGNKTLTLRAHRDIAVNAAIANTTGGSLILRADKNGSATGTVTFGGSGSVSMTGGGRTDIYYNPTAYTTPTNYAAKVTGTHTAWMLVNDVTQLQNINTNLAGSYALGKNIDASATSAWNAGLGFNPIGDNSTGTNASRFTGRFDGLNHTITGLTINRPTSNYVGLFGYVTNNSVMQNVGLESTNVVGQNYVGGLVGGYISGVTVTNTYSHGTVSGNGYIGGLIGNITGGSGAISNSHTTGSVTGGISGGNYAGGLIGSGGTISDSYSHSTVTSSGSYVGGLVGNGSIVTRSHATGKITGASYVGGLIGYKTGGTVTRTYATGEVSGSGNNVGGLIGENRAGTIEFSYATGDVSGSGYVGGLAGLNHGATISNSYATGNATGILHYVAGLVGRNEYSGIINNSYSSGVVSSGGSVGGLVASSYLSSTTNSYWNTQTSGRATSPGGGTGLTTAQMMEMARFGGWDISDEGAAGTVWRIYEGYTAPLLANFLTPLTVSAQDTTVAYSGTPFSGGTATYNGFKTGDDPSDLLGTLSYGGTAQGAINPGTYAITLLGGLYSGQQGYDIRYNAAPATLTIGAKPILMPVDTVRIITAGHAATTTSGATSTVALTDPAEDSKKTPENSASCLAAADDGACIVR